MAEDGYAYSGLRDGFGLDASLLTYGTGTDVYALDLSALRWERPLLDGFTDDTANPSLVANGAGVLLWSGEEGPTYARTAAGAQTSIPGRFLHKAADGPDLLLDGTAYRADAAGRFFTPSAPAPVTLRTNVESGLAVGEGKALSREYTTSGTACFLLDPGTGALGVAGTAITTVPLGACAAPGPLGINARQAIYPNATGIAYVIGAGANGRFGPEDLAGAAPLRIPGYTTPPQAALQLGGTLLLVSHDSLGTLLVDAGVDGLFNSGDDRVRVLGPRVRVQSQLAVSGEWIAWIDAGAPTGDQVYVMHGFDGTPLRVTATASQKSHVTVDRLGRIHWVDAGVSPRVIMSYLP